MPDDNANLYKSAETGERFAFTSLIDELCAQITPADDTVIIAIRNGGVSVADALRQSLKIELPIQYIDIAFYRDDYSRIGLNPNVGGSQLNAEIDDKAILLVDDVFHTGRTVRAALNEIFDYGRPRRIDLAVLAQRSGRELPVEPNYCARYFDLSATQQLVLSEDNSHLEVRYAGGLMP